MWVPNAVTKHSFKLGDIVRLTKDLELPEGVFLKHSEFRVGFKDGQMVLNPRRHGREAMIGPQVQSCQVRFEYLELVMVKEDAP